MVSTSSSRISLTCTRPDRRRVRLAAAFARAEDLTPLPPSPRRRGGDQRSPSLVGRGLGGRWAIFRAGRRLTPTQRRTLLAVAVLAAATLLLESALTRLLAVAQYYHFAFLVISLALLGFGASGTYLSLVRRSYPLDRVLALAGAGFALSTVIAYAVVNGLPFDSYSIAWERRQILFFALYYLALAVPFFCSGVGIGAALAAADGQSHRIYAANLFGSGIGALLALFALAAAGVPGVILMSAMIGLAAVFAGPRDGRGWSRLRGFSAAIECVGVAGLLLLGLLNAQARAPMGLTISPYKGLAHALRYPGATDLFQRWNAVSRADVIVDAGTRMLPGLSYAYAGVPPPQAGLSLDAGSPMPVTLIAPEEFAAADYLPEALAFKLRPVAAVLALEPGGGLGVLQALVTGGGATAPASRTVTAVVGNPLERQAAGRAAGAADVYRNPHVMTVSESARVFLRRDRTPYGLVYFPLTDAFKPLTSGAYSLGETYNLTVEAFDDALGRLGPGGILVMTRWMQTPPSESIRLIASLATALERRGATPAAARLVAYRGIQTITVLAQPDGWTAGELAQVRDFVATRRYDLVWAPDIRPNEVNRYNRMPEPADYLAIREFFDASDPRAFYAGYPYAVQPATDDRPFFFHFFKWQQTPEVLATLGRTWQPFGGSGYFVLLALLALVLVLSVALIVLPMVIGRPRGAPAAGRGVPRLRWRALAYFGFLGVAFLFVEIPLIQRWILLLGYPTCAFTAVVLSLLLCSSLGSVLVRAAWLPKRAAVAALVVLAFAAAALIGRLTDAALGWPLWARGAAAVLGLAPLGVLMGLPFPLGLAWLEEEARGLVPWAWAVNGSASVLASVLAAILALSYGFTAVLLLGASCYAAAWVLLFGSPGVRAGRPN